MDIAIIIFVLIVDQATKMWIQSNPAVLAGTELIPGFMYLNYVKNTGAAWSMLSGQQVLLSLIAVVEIGVLLWFLVKVRGKKRLTEAALALMIGGALGNLWDRLYLGYVRDFIDTYPFGYDFPVFNIADAALCIGVGLLMIEMIREDRKEKKSV